MTIATTTNRVDAPGNGSATSFSFAPVVIFAASNLQVTVRDSSGVETVISQGAGASNYSVTVSSYPGTGSITYPASGGSPLPTGSTIVIKRIVPLLQSVSLSNQGAYFPKIQEGEYDYLTAIDQQQQEQINRTVQVAVTDPATPILLPTSAARAGQFLGFDGSGNPIAALPSGAGVPISSVMQAVVAASSLAAAVTALFNSAAVAVLMPLLTVINGLTGGITRSIINKLLDRMTAADFGVVGDGTTNDTANMQLAINAAQAQARALHLRGTSGANFKITSPLAIVGPLRMIGAGVGQSIFTASGNFSSVLAIGSSAAQVWMEHFTISTTGTTTPCMKLALGAQVINSFQVEFTGNLNGTLVYSQAAGYTKYSECVWNCNASNTVGINLDGYNQNTSFLEGHAGGPGTFFVASNSTGNIANNVQGTKMVGFTSICTGAVAVTWGGAAFGNFMTGCIIDQATSSCVLIESGTSLTQILGGYYGVTDGVAGVAILLTNGAGVGNSIEGVQTYGGASAIQVQAVGSAIAGVDIINNLFNAAATVTVSLDSVQGCNIEGNRDLSTPTNGSWATSATLGAGAYSFSGNSWFTSTPVAVHSGSNYRAIPDRGITLSSKGTAVSASGTTLVVTHGCVLPPNIVHATPVGGSAMSWNVSTIGATTFTINYSVSGAATFMWTAERFA